MELTQCLEKVILQKVPLWVCRWNSPPVVSEDIEDAEDNNKKYGRPFGFETNGNHNTCTKTNDRHEDTGDGPCSLDNEAEEEENEEDTTSQ